MPTLRCRKCKSTNVEVTARLWHNPNDGSAKEMTKPETARCLECDLLDDFDRVLEPWEARKELRVPGENVIVDMQLRLEAVIVGEWDDSHDLASWVAALDVVRARVRRILDDMLLQQRPAA
jgi:hypothetical protein